MNRIFKLFLMLAGIMAVSCNAIQEEPDFTGEISGVVYYEGDPISGVNVTLSPGGDSFITKADGAYSFKSLKPEKYTLNFSKKGFCKVSKTITVTAGGVATGDIMMEPDPNSLSLDKELLSFGTKTSELEFTLSNSGIGVVSWEAGLSDKNVDWLKLSEDSGSIQTNGVAKVAVTVDRSKIAGDKASTNIHITSSTGQALNLKVEVAAGTPASVLIELLLLAPDRFDVRMTPSANTSKFCVLATKASAVSVDDILKEGTWYEGAEVRETIRFSNLTPGADYLLYTIAYNEYGQQSEVDKCIVELPSADDITLSSGTLDFGADKDQACLTIENKSSSDVDWEIINYKSDVKESWLSAKTSGTVLRYSSFDIPFSVDRSVLPAGTSTCEFDIKTSFSINFHVTVSVTNVGTPAYVDVTFIDVSSTEFRCYLEPSSNTGRFYVGASLSNEYDADYVEQYGVVLDNTGKVERTFGPLEPGTKYYVYVVAYNTEGQRGPLRIYEVTTESAPKVPTVDDYLGYWNLTANYYDGSQEESVSWSNIYIESVLVEGDDVPWIYVYGLMYGGGYPMFHALGWFDQRRGVIDLYGSWRDGNFKYGYEGSDDTYVATFMPTYSYWGNGEFHSYLIEHEDMNENVVASLSLGNDGKITMVGGNKADKNGRYANGYCFYEENLDDLTDRSWLVSLYNVVLTKSANPPSNAARLSSRLMLTPREETTGVKKALKRSEPVIPMDLLETIREFNASGIK